MTPSSALCHALSEVARRRPLLVVSDFDGTLSPIVTDHADAVLSDDALAPLLRLADRQGVHVGVISGRGYDDLAERVGPYPAVHLVGSHGAEYGAPAGGDSRHQRDALVAELADLVAPYEGARLEVKPVSGSVHTRRMTDRSAALALRDAALAGPAAVAGRRVKLGKEVIEIAVVAADKGMALRRLAAEVGASAVVYLGDDVTDEDAFAVLGDVDVGIKVGAGETAARYRVPDSAGVAAVLDHLAEVVAE